MVENHLTIGGDRLRLFFGESLSNRVYILGFFCPKQSQGFKSSAAHLYPNIGQVRNRTQTMVINIFNSLIFINLTSRNRMLTQLILNVKFIRMSKLNMFIIALCVLFLIKLRWPKNKSLNESYIGL